MDSNNIHLRNLSNNNFYPTKNWKWVIIFVNIIVFTQDGIHFILDGIIKSMDKIITNLFFIYLWQTNVSTTESTLILSGSSPDTRGSWPIWWQRTKNKQTDKRFTNWVHSNPLWILSGYSRELANSVWCVLSSHVCLKLIYSKIFSNSGHTKYTIPTRRHLFLSR